MKKAIALALIGTFIYSHPFSQTLQTVTENGSTTDRRITVETPTAGPMYTGRQMGWGYGFASPYAAVFYAKTDATSPSNVFLFSGYHGTDSELGSGSNSFYVRGDGVGYFAGNVGIGTNAPAYKLDVNGSIHSPNLGDLVPSLYLGNNAISDNIYQIQFGQDDSNQLGMGYYTSSKSIWSRFGLGVHVRENAEFSIKSSGWKNLFGIQGGTGDAYFAGNLGIGTTTPQSKLAVKGTITSTKVKVTQSGWPDYVFDSSYNLPSLPQIETFIQQNKHLPEVPSAIDVKKDGLDLGDNQAILLKKIEELTLYIIKQDKEMQEMKKELKEVKASLQNNSKMDL